MTSAAEGSYIRGVIIEWIMINMMKIKGRGTAIKAGATSEMGKEGTGAQATRTFSCPVPLPMRIAFAFLFTRKTESSPAKALTLGTGMHEPRSLPCALSSLIIGHDYIC